MDLVNETSLPAELYWGPSGEHEISGVVVVKATYDIDPAGLRVTVRNPWPVLAEELKTPWGTFPAEGPTRKPCVDLIVLGFARPPNGAAVPSMSVSLSAGSFHHELRVTGNRFWQRTPVGFRATEPVPFRAMPLTWANAFGGVSRCPTGPISWGDNPEGKGFVFEGASPEGVPLPNVEDPHCLVRQPTDWPKPAGWAPYPATGGYRMKKLMDERGQALPFAEVARFVTGWAHPDLLVDRLAPGDPIVVQGVTGGPPLSTVVPECPARASMEAGAERHALALRLDTLVVVAEEKRLVARWHGEGAVRMRPREVRRVHIEAA